MKKRILITGGSGTIGTALTKRLLLDGNIVCVFDNDENGLFNLENKIDKRFKDKVRFFLGDIRDLDRLDIACNKVESIFHCAALKHVMLNEYNPIEAVKTNVDGVSNVILAALRNKVERVVFTSSDKAVNPTSTMGTTKLLGERLITSANNLVGDSPTRFSSVRFGNVFNSRGSVIEIFRNQIKNRLPVTITHEDMSRFFLTTDDAVDLCILTERRMKGAEIFIKNMGSFKITDLALAMYKDIKNVKFDYVGLKPGEKIYEELITDQEAVRAYSKDDIIIVLPDTVESMPANLIHSYNEIKSSYSFYNNARTP